MRISSRLLALFILGAAVSAAVPVSAQSLDRIVINPRSVSGGAGTNGVVSLTAPAPAGGAVVTLASDDPSVTVPASVTIPAGAPSATFAIATRAVTADAKPSIKATYSGITKSTALSLTAQPTVARVGLNPSSVSGGTSAAGMVLLSGPAPAGGTVVTLACDTPTAVVPASITIPAGSTSGTFTLSTIGVTSDAKPTITATSGGDSKTLAFTITSSPAVARVAFSPGSLSGGASGTGVVLLNGPSADGGTVVALSSDNASVLVPAKVTVPAGERTASFSIQSIPATADTVANITATAGGQAVTSRLPLTVAAALNAVSIRPNPISGGTTATGTILLNGPAPSGGAVVALSSDSAAAVVPASVTVPAGAKSAVFAIGTPAGANLTATIAASYAGVDKSTKITIAPTTASKSKSGGHSDVNVKSDVEHHVEGSILSKIIHF